MKLVVPELISCIRLITDEIPPLVEQIRTWAIENSSELPTFQETLKSVDVDWQSMLKKGLDLVLAGAGGIFNSLVAVAAGVVGRTAELLIALIFAIYLLAEKEVLKKQADRLLRACFKPGTRKQLLYVAATFHETFTNFITGQCMEAVIIGLLCTLGMSSSDSLRAYDRRCGGGDGADSRGGRVYWGCCGRLYGVYGEPAPGPFVPGVPGGAPAA